MIKISIITATYNAADCLNNLINSIIPQKTREVEFIIIDGNSKDSTIEIIKNSPCIDYWISEPDKGIYDAWNKGIAKASGEWIMFLGADDFLTPDAIKIYLDFLSENSAALDLEYISSKVQMINKKGLPIWVNGEKWEWPQFKYKMTVAHPGSLHSKKLFAKYGIYDIEYKIIGDYELLLRPKENLKTAFINKITVKMTEGGISDSWAGIKEYIRATVKKGGGNTLKAQFMGSYMFVKSKINKYGRVIGVNLNKKRPTN